MGSPRLEVRDLTEAEEEILAQCRRFAANAYAPYSSLHVVAAVVDENGKMHFGVNVENQAHPSGTCAEQAAIAVLCLSGARSIERLYLYSQPEVGIVPCGACRQRLAELGAPEMPVIIFHDNDSASQTTLGELLPFAFRYR